MAEYLPILELMFAVLLTVVGMLGLRGLRSSSSWLRWLSGASVVAVVVVLGLLLWIRVQGGIEVRAQEREHLTFRAELLDKIEKAETLAKAIPKGCLKGLDHKPWAIKVEDWRAETARILARHDLDRAFTPDRGDYPHRCKLEWVRNRLDYFTEKAQAVSWALGTR